MEKRTTPGDGTEARVTQYLYDVMAPDCQILSETTDGKTTGYVYGAGKLNTYTEEGTSRYLHDARGSIIADITESGTKEYRYAPYGSLLTGNSTQAQEGAAGETESGDFYGYNGEAYHGDLGMIYLRARWYEPEQMRFSQKGGIAI